MDQRITWRELLGSFKASNGDTLIQGFSRWGSTDILSNLHGFTVGHLNYLCATNWFRARFYVFYSNTIAPYFVFQDIVLSTGSSAHPQRSRERQSWGAPQMTPCPSICPQAHARTHQAHFYKPRGPWEHQGRCREPKIRMNVEDKPPWADPGDSQPQGPGVTPMRRSQCFGTEGSLPRSVGHVREYLSLPWKPESSPPGISGCPRLTWTPVSHPGNYVDRYQSSPAAGILKTFYTCGKASTQEAEVCPGFTARASTERWNEIMMLDH